MTGNREAHWQVLFSGHVQGVGFRHTACQVARSLKLTGWVRNRSDGRVELVAAGSRVAVQNLVAQICSSTWGEVTSHELVSIPASSKFSEFTVRRS
jgi:acylphosphatase